MSIRVSIITVCLNEEATIARAVDSVIRQDYENVEYIVVDGQSTDRTGEILQRYQSRIDKLIVEADDGLYHAMNRALDCISGEVVYFLNADDYLYDAQVVGSAAGRFAADPSLDILSGRLEFFNTPTVNGAPYRRTEFRFHDKLQLYRRPNPQQCIFARSRLFDLIGKFDTRYRLCADYEWLIRAINRNAKIEFVDDIFCYFDYSGISYTQNERRKREKRRIILENSSFLELCRFGIAGVGQVLRQDLR